MKRSDRFQDNRRDDAPPRRRPRDDGADEESSRSILPLFVAGGVGVGVVVLVAMIAFVFLFLRPRSVPAVPQPVAVAQPQPDHGPQPQPVPKSAVPATPSWVDASKDASRHGEIEVSVVSVRYATISAWADSPFRGKGPEVDGPELLHVELTVRNASASKIADFQTWAPHRNILKRVEVPRHQANLRDSVGNRYDQLFSDHDIQIRDHYPRSGRIRPGESVNGKLFFEKPVPAAEWLQLELDMQAVDGADGVARLRFPVSMIKRDGDPEPLKAPTAVPKTTPQKAKPRSIPKATPDVSPKPVPEKEERKFKMSAPDGELVGPELPEALGIATVRTQAAKLKGQRVRLAGTVASHYTEGGTLYLVFKAAGDTLCTMPIEAAQRDQLPASLPEGKWAVRVEARVDGVSAGQLQLSGVTVLNHGK